MLSQRNIVRIAVGTFLVVAQLVVFIHAVARHKWSPALPRIRAVCWRLKSFFWPSTSPDSDIDIAIRQKILAFRVQAFKRVSGIMSFCFSVAVLQIIYKSLLEFEQHNSIIQDMLVFTAYALTLLMQFRPNLVNSSNVGCWHCCFVAMLVLFVAPGICTPERMVQIDGLLILFSGLLSISNLSTQYTMVCQSVVAATLTWQHIELRDHKQADLAILPLLFITCAGICVCTGLLAKGLHWTLRNELEAGVLDGKQSAGNALLKIFYDVVLEVDTDLTIVGVTGNLGSFLQSRPGKSFQNISLQNLLPQEADKERIVEFLQHAPGADEPGTSLANVLHIMMSGGDTDGLEVEFFSFHFKGPSGQAHHLIGLREFTDDKVALEASSSSIPVQANASWEPTVVPSAGPPWFRIDTAQTTAPVLAFSANFQSLMGLTRDSTTLQMLTQESEAVLRWTQMSVNKHLASERSTEESDTFKVLLRPQNQATELVRATLCIDLSDLADVLGERDLSECDTLPVVFVLQKTNTVKVKRRHGGDRSSGTSSSRSAGSASRGTPQHADRRCVGCLPAATTEDRVQSL